MVRLMLCSEKRLHERRLAFMREAMVALSLAKEVLGMQQEWRREAVMHLNHTRHFLRTLTNSMTDWPCIFLQILSDAAEIDFFQLKLVINNIDVLWRTVITDGSIVPAAMYHESLIWRVIEMGVNDRCLIVIFITSERALTPPLPAGSLYMEEMHAKLGEELWFTIEVLSFLPLMACFKLKVNIQKKQGSASLARVNVAHK